MKNFEPLRAAFDEAHASQAIKRAPREQEYAGMDYSSSSKMGVALCAAAAKTGKWDQLPEHLSVLRQHLR